MNQLTRQSLSVILGITVFGTIAHSTNAQEVAIADFQVNPIETELTSNNVQINTIEQQATGQPIPGTTATTIAAFMSEENTDQTQITSDFIPLEITQNTTDPEIIFRHDYSYIGVGGNVGVKLEQTSLGRSAFAVNSKIALAQELSLRPAVLFGQNETVFLVPITYDVTIKDKDPFKEVPYVPFIGGGAMFTTDNNNNAGFLITGGLDYRLSQDFVANITLHTGFSQNSTDMGLVLGVGYIIPQKNR